MTRAAENVDGVSDTRRDELVERFNQAVAEMPAEVAARLALGQQFNAYEAADNEEDEDPDWLEYQLSIGPIDNRRFILTVEGQSVAMLLEAALKLASHIAKAQGDGQ